MVHYSVLYNEVLETLRPHGGQIFIDGTAGAGGHTKGLAEAVTPSGRVIAFDRDESALELASQNLAAYSNITYCHSNYTEMGVALKKLGILKVQGILLDIGVSSMQLDQAHRGFSFRQELDGELDMRMDRSSGMSAMQYLQHVSKQELEQVIRDFGEERFYRRVAQAICMAREKKMITTTSALAEIIRSAIPGPKGKIDKATRTFQALRIRVNDELGALERVIPEATSLLEAGGRLAIISFHSLEDRIVKWAFRKMQEDGLGIIITKKPMMAEEAELQENARSRSAKLRVFEKL